MIGLQATDQNSISAAIMASGSEHPPETRFTFTTIEDIDGNGIPLKSEVLLS
jgi:hypothetical protein